MIVDGDFINCSELYDHLPEESLVDVVVEIDEGQLSRENDTDIMFINLDT